MTIAHRFETARLQFAAEAKRLGKAIEAAGLQWDAVPYDPYSSAEEIVQAVGNGFVLIGARTPDRSIFPSAEAGWMFKLWATVALANDLRTGDIYGQVFKDFSANQDVLALAIIMTQNRDVYMSVRDHGPSDEVAWAYQEFLDYFDIGIPDYETKGSGYGLLGMVLSKAFLGTYRSAH